MEPASDLTIDLSVDEAALPGAVEVLHRSFAEYALTETPSGAMVETAETLAEEMRGGTSVALVRRGAVPVAFAKHHAADDGTLYFGRLGVVPEARGTGVARMLVEALREHALAAGLDGLSCLVRADEEGNIALYERCGMKIVGRGERVSRLGATIAVVEMRDIEMRDSAPRS